MFEEGVVVEGFVMLCCLVVLIIGVCCIVFDCELCEKVLFVIIVFDVEGKFVVLFVKKLVVLVKIVGVDVIVFELFECVFDGKVEVLFYCYIVCGVVLVDGL